jgi:hypothetical protein
MMALRRDWLVVCWDGPVRQVRSVGDSAACRSGGSCGWALLVDGDVSTASSREVQPGRERRNDACSQTCNCGRAKGEVRDERAGYRNGLPVQELFQRGQGRPPGA